MDTQAQEGLITLSYCLYLNCFQGGEYSARLQLLIIIEVQVEFKQCGIVSIDIGYIVIVKVNYY